MARYSIGRSRENDVVLADTTVSRQHAEIEDLGGGRYVLRDVGSSRGTLVQSGGQWQEITEIEVTAETPVLLGDLQTTVSALLQEASAAPAAAVPPADQAAAAPAPPAQPAAAPAAPAAASSSGGGGLSPGAKWALIGGGIFLAVAIVTAVVLVLLLGGDKGSLGGGPGSVPGLGSGPSPGPSGGGSADSRFVAACTKVGGANETQCRCMAKVARGELNDGEFEIFTLSMEARGDPAKQAELRKRSQELLALAGKLRGLARKVAAECR